MKLMFSIVAASAVALSVSAFAQTSPFTGVYLSAAGGYSEMAHQLRVESNFGPAAPEVRKRDIALMQSAFTGAFSLGYGYTFSNNLYLGGEFGYDLFSDYGKERSSTDISGTVDNTDVNVRLSRQYRLSVMFGKVVANELLVYAKLSGVYGKMSNDLEDTGRISGDQGSVADYHNFIYGGAIGAGVEWQLVGGLSLRAEYDYTKYSNIAYRAGRDIIPGVSRQDINGSDDLSASQFLLGLTYRF